MDGFVTESVAKITDGFLATLRLLLIYFFIRLLLIPVERLFGRTGLIVYIVLTLGLAVFELLRSLLVNMDDRRRIWTGMTAGLLFWLTLSMTSAAGSFPLSGQFSMAVWLLLAIVTAILLAMGLPAWVRLGLLVFATGWLGKIYYDNLMFSNGWVPWISFGYNCLPFLVMTAGAAAIIYIIFRSSNSSNRSLASIIIFNAVLCLFRAFK